MGHEYCGIVEEVGRAVTSVKPGQFVIGSFFASDRLDLGRLWRQFKTALDVFGESGADSARVIAGALAAYALIRDILSGLDASPGAI